MKCKLVLYRSANDNENKAIENGKGQITITKKQQKKTYIFKFY